MTIPDCQLAELCRWAETWLPTLAPVGPVYIVNSRLPAAMSGCTGENVDLAYRSEIGDQWKGRGVAILLDTNKYQLDTQRLRAVNNADDATIHAMEGYVVKTVLRLLLHEIGHAVMWTPSAVTSRKTQQDIRQTIDADVSAWTTPTTIDSRLPSPFSDHAADFVRACLHLHFRARRQGVSLPLFGLAAGYQYGMASIEKYRQALGNEPWRLQDASFQVIASSPPPRRFVDLWAADVANWLRRCAKKGELTDEIIRTAIWSANIFCVPVITREKLVSIVATS